MRLGATASFSSRQVARTPAKNKRRKAMKKLPHLLIILLCLLLCLTALSGCTGSPEEQGYQKNTQLDTSQEVRLVIASGGKTWAEMETVGAKFSEIYPNCTVICEYIEEYTDNLPLRLNQTEEKVDIFRTVNIQENTVYKDNALNLISEEAQEILDLSGANPGLVANFRYTGAENTQYAIPYGGEMRGLYVNLTLLEQNGLELPTNRSELLHCCQVLYEKGYVPLQSTPGTFAQQLLYPYICNSIVNGGSYEEMYAAIENLDDGISEYFRDSYTFLYDLVEKGYYDYKRVEEELGYTFDGSAGKAREFLNITPLGDDLYEKQDDIGKIAFMPDTQAFAQSLDKTKSDYHSLIEYAFILSPVGENGGYAYLSPSDGLAVNNQSDNIDWALEFLNFFFTPEIATAFAEETGKIPNTADALLKYEVPEGHACDVGQVTFSYPFYKTVTTPMLNGYEDDMIGISKMNAKKYMKDNGDGSYSLMYSLEDYLDRLEQEFQLIKSERMGAGA